MSYKQKAIHIQPKTPRQDQLLRAIASDAPLILASGSAGTGKAQPLDAKVLTPSGWTTMGQLRVGDEITGFDGRPQTVTGVFPQGRRQVYRVTTNDGRSTEACAEHLWYVGHNNFKAEKRVVSTQSMIDFYAKSKARKNKYFRIPVFKGVPDQPAEQGVNAYLTGWVIATRKWSYGGRDWPRVIPRKLVDLWPNAVLSGLLDGGCRVRRDREIEWSNKRGTNSDLVVELVRRTGGIATRSDASSEMIVWWQNPERIIRNFKKARKTSARRKTQSCLVKSIVPSRVTETQCISVSNPDRLYITDDYLVTHNTYCAVNGGLNYMYKNRMSQMILTRSNQPIGRSLGYFPGTVEEKLQPWLAPMLGEIKKRMQAGEYEVAQKRMIQLQPLETIRGQSFDNSLILIDEAQNLSWDEIKAVTTRVGENSKMIMMGDPNQRDTPRDDFTRFIALTQSSDYVQSVEFTHEDVVRSGLTKELLRLFEQEAKG